MGPGVSLARTLVAVLVVAAVSSTARAQVDPAADPETEPPDEEVAVLEAELELLRARLEQLEGRVKACEQPADATTEPAAPGAAPLAPPRPPAPPDPAEPEQAPRLVLPPTGQTLADKVRFLESRCVDTDPCTRPLLAKKVLLRTMTIDQVRGYSSSVTRCAHQCAVELAVNEATARANPTGPPDEAVGLLPEGPRGLPPYPGADAPLADLQRFLDLRCREVACARLDFRTREGATPAVEAFVRTCAQACADSLALPSPTPPAR